MIIDDDSGEETIYQTEKEGGEDFPGQGQGAPPRGKPPTPDEAPALGRKRKCSGDDCVGRVKWDPHNPNHEFHRIPYNPRDQYYVRIFPADATSTTPPIYEYPAPVPGNAVLYIVGSGNDRQIEWRHNGVERAPATPPMEPPGG